MLSSRRVGRLGLRPIPRFSSRLANQILISAVGIVGLAPTACGQVSGSTFSLRQMSHSENFDFLGSTPSFGTTLSPGLYFKETTDSSYRVDDGSNNTGDTYSYGSANMGDRAFGSLRSGANVPTLGLAFVNNTGSAISAAVISYAGEVYRLGATGRFDVLQFGYAVNQSAWNTASYSSASQLDFIGPDVVTTVTAYNGNQGRTPVSGMIDGLNLGNGQTFFIQWSDFDASGADDGLGIDDLRIQFLARDITWDANDATPGIEEGAGVWSNGSTRFNTGGGTVAYSNASPDLVRFGNGGGAGSHAISVSGTVRAGYLSFTGSSPAYTLSGGTIELLGGMDDQNGSTINSSVKLVSDGNWNVASGVTTSVTGNVSGEGGMFKTGEGTLLLSGTNTFTGAFSQNAGTTIVSAGGLSGTTDISTSGTSRLKLSGGGNQINDDATVEVNSGIGTFTSPAIFDLNNDHEKIGRLVLVNGQVDTGTGTLEIGKDIVTHAAYGGTSASAVINGKLEFGSTKKTIAVQSGQPDPDLLINAAISGTGEIYKENSGWMRLTADSGNFTGSLTIGSGRVILADGGALSAISGATLRPGSTLLLNNQLASSSSTRLNDNSHLTLGGGTLELRAANGTSVTEEIGTLNLASGQSVMHLFPGTTTSTAEFNVNNIGTRDVGATLVFTAPSLQVGVTTSGRTPKVTIDGLANGYLGPHAFIATTTGMEFAHYDNTVGVRAPISGEYGTSGSDLNIRTSSTVTIPASSATTNSINLTGNATVNWSGTATLTIQSGGVLKSGGTSIGSFGTSSAQYAHPGAGNEWIFNINAGSLATYCRMVDNPGASGTVSLTKTGAGTFYVLNTSLAYTGTTTVNQGTFLVSSAGLSGTGTLNINAGGALQVNGATDTGINNAAYVNLVGNGGNSTSVPLARLVVSSGAVENIGTLNLQGAAVISGGGRLVLTQNVTRDATGAGVASISVTTLNLGPSGSGISRSIVVNDSPYTDVDLHVSSTIADPDAGTSHKLVKSGNGTLRLTGANTYKGGTEVNNGTLLLTANSALPSSGLTTVDGSSNTAVLDIAQTTQTSNFDLKTGIVTGNGTVTWNGNLSSSGVSRFQPSAIISTTAGFSRTIAVSSGSLTLAGPVLNGAGGNNGIIKTGAGTLITEAANIYTNTTVVNAGALIVNGTHSPAGGAQGYSINAGTLGGSGTITLATGQSVNVAAGAVVAPGNSPGTLSINGDFTLANDVTSTLEIEVGGSPNNPGIDFDVLYVSGGLTINGAHLNVIPLSGAMLNQEYKIVDAPSYSSSGNLFGKLNDMLGSNNYNTNPYVKYSLRYEDSDGIYLTFTAVPEPATAGAGALACSLLPRRKRQRNRQTTS